jgi:hypothetical protein
MPSGLRAGAVVDVEQAAGVVAVLYLQEAGVVVASERCLPVGFEVIGLVEVGGGLLAEGSERRHGRGDER